jgi:hypothetical protein
VDNRLSHEEIARSGGHVTDADCLSDSHQRARCVCES